MYLFSIGEFNTDRGVMVSNWAAKFEDIICEHIQALGELKRVRNLNKRACIYYTAIGYNQDLIASELHIAQQTVSRHLIWLKKFFEK